MKMNKNSGFTLLEIIIVIIIVGVLASLALPRLFSTVEFSRSGEALNSFSSIRSSMERCYLQSSGDYTNCSDFNDLDLEDPGISPNAHFTFTITINDPVTYSIRAMRDTAVEGGTVGDWVQIEQTLTSVLRSGTGAFKGIK